MAEELDQDLDNDEEVEDGEEDEPLDDEEDESTDGEDDSESDDGSESKAPTKEEKRVRALQSKLDQAIAENNRLKKSQMPPTKNGKPRDPEVERLMAFALDQTRKSLYETEPRLKKYQIAPEVIRGTTPEEMQANLKELKRLVSRIETGARNETLREHGFSPAPRDAGADKPRNFSSMSSEEFDKLVKEQAGM
jgi:hypothetical protein